MEILIEILENIVKLINAKYFFIYILSINIIGFLFMFIDKYKARKGYWRIPESTLFLITFLGGGIGTIIGMYLFRHKTKKLKFTIGFPTILLLEIVLIFYCIIKYRI